MPNLFEIKKGDTTLMVEEHQLPNYESKGFVVVKRDLPGSPDEVPGIPKGLVKIIKGDDTLLIEPVQLPRFLTLGYKEAEDGKVDSDQGSGSPNGSEGAPTGGSPDGGAERWDSQSASGAEAPDEQAGGQEDLTPAERVALAKIEQIQNALGGLDPLDDKIWTKHGAPRVAAVSDAAGFPVTQDDIEKAWPGFTRPE